LWRAVDEHGAELDVLVQKRRDKAAATQRYTELNAAYQCLLEPRERLLHLLELEHGAKPKDIQEIPGSLADMFAEVATVCRNADQFLEEKSRVASPLLQVELFERAQEWTEKLQLLQKKLRDFSERLLAELKLLDTKWMAGDSKTRGDLLNELEKLYRLFSYFNRWNGQIQERIVQLSL